MEFLGLNIVLILLLVTGCTCQEDEWRMLVKYQIGDATPMDTMLLKVQGEKICIESSSVYQPGCFTFYEKHNNLYISRSDCQSLTKVPLKVGEVIDFICEPFDPFMGRSIWVLDQKAFHVKSVEYNVFKLGNENYSTHSGTTIFWLSNYGVVLIELNGTGSYYVLQGNKVELLEKLREDLDFSDLRPIPPLPPLPPEDVDDGMESLLHD